MHIKNHYTCTTLHGCMNGSAPHLRASVKVNKNIRTQQISAHEHHEVVLLYVASTHTHEVINSIIVRRHTGVCAP